MKSERESLNAIAEVLLDALESGAKVEIDGLGTFLPGEDGKIRFVDRSLPKVFISYVHEDGEAAERIFTELTAVGFDPWLDRRKLMPGQNWPRSVEDAINFSDFVIACFSDRSVSKKGGFQSEIRYALDCATRMPLDEVFLIPVRFDECRVPVRIQKEVQYVDLFPNWDIGIRRIIEIINKEMTRKREK
jgi:TIR domain